MISHPLPPDAHGRLQAALRSLAHRGPDGEGAWSNPEATVLLGHRRLSILDLSDSAAQPMVTAGGRGALTYNGELYNFADLRWKLQQHNIPQRSSGDTDTLLHWLDEYGAGGLASLEGMFAFGYWNQAQQTLLLARDPLGIKPLYYACVDHGGRPLLLFASELRALLATGLISRRISPEGLAGYLGWGAVQCPRTILNDVRELPPGNTLTVTPAGKVRIEAWWHPTYPPRSTPPPAAEASLLRQKLGAAVQSHLASDVPLGAFLSGGVDSSTITALMASAGARPETLSVVFPDEAAFSEAAISTQVAERYGTRHRRIEISAAESLRLCQEALQAQDQPSADGVNVFIVSAAARRAGLKVALSGLGADELFAGYPSFRDVPATSRILARLGPSGQTLLTAALAAPLRLRPWNRRLQKLWQLSRVPRSLAGAGRARRRVFSDGQIARLTGGLLLEAGDPDGFWRGWELETSAWDPADAVSWLEMRAYMGNTLLRDADVMGMAHSLEIRVPFLHTPLVDWVQAQGPQMRRTIPRPKQALLDAVIDLLPESSWKRPKQGFTLPFESWLRGPLRAQVERAFLQPSTEWFSPPVLRDLWNAWQLNPRQTGWYRVWSLYALLHWLDRLESGGDR